MQQLSEAIRPIEAFSAQARTTTANSSGIDLWANGRPQELVVLQSVGAVSGTTPVLAMTVQDSDDNSTFANITGAAFTNTTAAAFKELRVNRPMRRYVRVVATITGTTPSFTFAAIVILGEPLDAPI